MSACRAPGSSSSSSSSSQPDSPVLGSQGPASGKLAQRNHTTTTTTNTTHYSSLDGLGSGAAPHWAARNTMVADGHSSGLSREANSELKNGRQRVIRERESAFLQGVVTGYCQPESSCRPLVSGGRGGRGWGQPPPASTSISQHVSILLTPLLLLLLLILF